MVQANAFSFVDNVSANLCSTAFLMSSSDFFVFSGGVSLSITLFNKAVFSWYQFNFSATLTLAQMIFSIILLLSMRKIGLIDFPDPDLPTCSKLLPLACFFVWYAFVCELNNCIDYD
jgi:hypothetical protein